MRQERSARTLRTYARGSGWVIALGLTIVAVAALIAAVMTWTMA